MEILINLKTLGKKSRRIRPVSFIYEKKPETLREFIDQTVLIMVRAFKERQKKSKEGFLPEALSEQAINDMAELGKVAFGYIYNENEVSEEKVIKTAEDAVIDGLVKIFINGSDITDMALDLRNVEIDEIEAFYASHLEKKIEINEGDQVTFVKLAMLAGRRW